MFKETLSNLLQMKGLTPYKVSKETKIPKSIIYEWVSGEREPISDYVIKLADYLDCSIDYLLGRTDNSESDCDKQKTNNTTTTVSIDSLSDFWERFYNLCIQQGVKPNRLGKEIGVSSGTISKWKNEDTIPNGETLIKIADYLGCSTDYLLGRTDNPENDYDKPESNTTTKVSVNSLSDNEWKLILFYRSLDSEKKGRIMERAEILAESYSEPVKRNA